MPREADENGVLEGSFTIPQGVPSGTVLVAFTGSQGSYGTARYTSSGEIVIELRRNVTTVTYNYDPLAQTFTLPEGRHIAGCDLWFRVKGSSRVKVQIRETTVGFPNKNVIAQADVPASVINVDGTHTRVLFRSPVWLDGGTEYALVLLTDDPNTSVAIAELGKLDTVHNAWVTAQAYQTGVLLSSSNASTWTSHQELDLTFRLLACKFTETNYMVDMGTIEADQHTDILALANVERPSSETDCEFIYTDSDGNVNALSEDMATQLSAKINGEISVKARLKGNSKQSPVLYPGVQTVLGKIHESADYVTRAITAGTNVKISVIYDSLTPGSSEVKVYCQNPDSTWQLVQLASGTPVGNSWEERTHVLENFSGDTTRVKLVLSGTVLYRPKVQNLRVIVV